MASTAGVEPAASGLGILRSILLSYEDVKVMVAPVYCPLRE